MAFNPGYQPQAAQIITKSMDSISRNIGDAAESIGDIYFQRRAEVDSMHEDLKKFEKMGMVNEDSLTAFEEGNMKEKRRILGELRATDYTAQRQMAKEAAQYEIQGKKLNNELNTFNLDRAKTNAAISDEQRANYNAYLNNRRGGSVPDSIPAEYGPQVYQDPPTEGIQTDPAALLNRGGSFGAASGQLDMPVGEMMARFGKEGTEAILAQRDSERKNTEWQQSQTLFDQGQKSLEIGFGIKGKAPTVKEATDLRGLTSSAASSNNLINSLITIADKPYFEKTLSPATRAEANQYIAMLRGKLRTIIVGPGAVTDSERKIIEEVIQSPTDIIQWQSPGTKLKTLQKVLNDVVRDTVTSYPGLEVTEESSFYSGGNPTTAQGKQALDDPSLDAEFTDDQRFPSSQPQPRQMERERFNQFNSYGGSIPGPINVPPAQRQNINQMLKNYSLLGR